jgi:hypothetical protein
VAGERDVDSGDDEEPDQGGANQLPGLAPGLRARLIELGGLDPKLRARIVGIGAQLAVYGAPGRVPSGLTSFMEQQARVVLPFEDVRVAIAEWSSAFDWSGLKAAGSVLRTAVSIVRPWNLHDVDLDDMEAVAALAMEDGIPVAWVPRAALVGKLLATAPGDDRFSLMGEHADEILDDCIAILDEREVRTRFAGRCREAIAAHRAGHLAAAQSHAANIIDSLVMETFEHPPRPTATRLGSEPWLDTTLGQMSANLALRPVVHAFVSWWADDGEPVPARFSRHVTAHAASEPTAFTAVTALVAVMLGTSLTVEFAPNSGVDELEPDG